MATERSASEIYEGLEENFSQGDEMYLVQIAERLDTDSKRFIYKTIGGGWTDLDEYDACQNLELKDAVREMEDAGLIESHNENIRRTEKGQCFYEGVRILSEDLGVEKEKIMKELASLFSADPWTVYSELPGYRNSISESCDTGHEEVLTVLDSMWELNLVGFRGGEIVPRLDNEDALIEIYSIDRDLSEIIEDSSQVLLEKDNGEVENSGLEDEEFEIIQSKLSEPDSEGEDGELYLDLAVDLVNNLKKENEDLVQTTAHLRNVGDLLQRATADDRLVYERETDRFRLTS